MTELFSFRSLSLSKKCIVLPWGEWMYVHVVDCSGVRVGLDSKRLDLTEGTLTVDRLTER